MTTLFSANLHQPFSNPSLLEILCLFLYFSEKLFGKFISTMKKTVLLYGLSLAVLVTFLKIIEYKYWIRDFSVEVYIGIIGLGFTALGLWVGTKIISRKREVQIVVRTDFKLNETELQRTGISQREFEVLELMASGFSNQEIADKLFISLSTVKTHSANLFSKLDAKRRTQAVQRAKELQIIP